ncbi:MAG: YhjD/YihY/BrkB family envelope integrity protein, partial [SAR202 cluster bacterium]|nr:YhjD/YihY/BrkB family envelope integrity protein [SAR202 cluster bacterium]
VSPVLSFTTFLVLYRFIPNTEVRIRDVWLGALVASMAFDGAKWGFLFYIRTFPVYNVVYGSVGAVMALLTWVYVSAIILLFGALATSRYQGFSAKVGRDVRGIRLLWTGLTRVRLRVVALPEAG